VVLKSHIPKIPFLKIWPGSPRPIDPDAVAFRWGLDYDSADLPAEVSPVADYSEQWTRYKRLRNTWLTFFLAELAFYFGPLDRLTWRTFRPVFPTVDPIYFFVGPLFVIGVLLIIAGDSLRKWKCPRCGKPFAGGLKTADQFRTYLNWLFLPKQCRACGLSKYAADSHADQIAQPISPQG